MSGSILAVAVFIIGAVASLIWFGVNRRREVETEIGIQWLANMKWRDGIAIVLEALQREGYEQKVDQTAPTAGNRGNDSLLAHGDVKVLLAYKHGTSYRLGEASVNEFASAMQQRGAKKGIFVTLGSAEPGAGDAAKELGVELLDGRSLWLKVRQLMPPEALQKVGSQAAAQTRKGVLSGLVGSFVAGLAAYLVGNLLLSAGADANLATPTAPSAIQSAGPLVQAPPPVDPMLEQLNATAKAMAEVAKLSSSERAKRRAQAAKEIALMPQVNTAAWSAESRLLVTLNQSDGKDKILIDEMCALITRYEELRFTRIQMEPPQGSNFPVRWRLCD